jgi:hypothetical protein
MSVFTTITNIEYYQSLVDDAVEGETVWSINKNAKPGDVVLLYVCAPKSAIVATAIIADIPYLEENINSEFFNTWFAEMNELILLNTSISRHHLREIFHDWGYWKQPRNSVQVKTEYLSELLPLVAKHI